MPFFAHTDPNSSDPRDWEPLFTPFGDAHDQCAGEACEKCARLDRFHGHLNKVAWWTAMFAGEMFPAGSPEAKAVREWGYLAGLWHDLGKFAERWQRYLRTKSDIHSDEVVGRMDHATAGAKHAVIAFPVIGHILAFAIAGHHSGLLDTISENACQEKRLDQCVPDLSQVPASILDRLQPPMPHSIAGDLSSASVSVFSRMLFSCLVDADFLATESFMNPKQSGLRPQNTGSFFPEMLRLLDQNIASFGQPVTPVAKSRSGVYQNCVEAASSPLGLFSLNVPTGGGKTLSSLAFALGHAVRHGQRRVIYVIPFTSIIEQNAGVFEDVFAPLTAPDSPPVVLEHHSNLSPEKETERSRLAAENWDAPLVVTTAVQFYESLHAARTSSCRKLHNIANAVVILDEAQCLPVDYLRPCLESLRQLSSHYRTSVVLCTATQPAIHHRPEFPIGLHDIRAIIPDARSLSKELERVRVVDRGMMTDSLLTAEISEAFQVLVIVNTRKHAQKLFQLLPKGTRNFHLSALMCPQHRRAVLDGVRRRLDAGESVRLISTQLIEAGVDIDFPLVYRSLAGIDSIAQAAGRCNRNGRLPMGETYIFRSEHQRAEAYFRETAQVADRVLSLFENPLGLESVEKYFQLYYLAHNPANAPKWDTKDIGGDFKLDRGSRKLPMLFQFRSTAEKFRLIENEQVTVIIPFDETARKLVSELRNETIPLHRNLLRALQRYTVQIYKPEFEKNRVQFEPLRNDQFQILICPETHYSEHFGLHLDSDNQNPLICE
jgi:CRISPR-associated endonuclease/helicase Cas3